MKKDRLEWGVYIRIRYTERKKQPLDIFGKDEIKIRYLRDLARSVSKLGASVLAAAVCDDVIELLLGEMYETEVAELLRMTHASFGCTYRKEKTVKIVKTYKYLENIEQVAACMNEISRIGSPKWNSVTYFLSGEWQFEEILDKKRVKDNFIFDGVDFNLKNE